MGRKNLNFLKSAISRIVKPPDQGFRTKFWPREMKIAKILFEKYPDEEFWSNFNLDFKLNSLAWFNTKDGILTLENKYKQFHYKPPEKKEALQISEEKFGEDRAVSKPRFAKDFLD